MSFRVRIVFPNRGLLYKGEDVVGIFHVSNLDSERLFSCHFFGRGIFESTSIERIMAWVNEVSVGPETQPNNINTKANQEFIAECKRAEKIDDIVGELIDAIPEEVKQDKQLSLW